MTSIADSGAAVPGLVTRSSRALAGRIGRAFERLVLLVVLLLLWQMVTVAVDSLYFPPPTEILGTLHEEWLSGPATRLWLTESGAANIASSVVRVALGWSLAVIVGVAVGFAIGASGRLADYLDPVIEFSRAVPPPALIPLFLVLFGTGAGMKLLLIAFGSVWPILLNTVDGVRSVDALQLDTASVFRVGRGRRLLRVILPAASPRIMAGARVALSLAIILMVVSEMVATTNGVGFAIVRAQRVFAIDEMWAGIVVLAIMGLVLNSILVSAEHRVLHWHHGAHGMEG